MNRAEYMRELAFLLQDVPDGEREEALQYYEDYFDDAGPDREEQVIGELGRPEKVAAIIREGVRNGYESPDAEYTENGYRNERYRGPQYEIVPPKQVERKRIGDGTAAGEDSGTSGKYGWEWSKERGQDRGNVEEDTWGNRARSVFNELGQRLSEGVEEGRRRMEEGRERRRREEEWRRAASGKMYEEPEQSGTTDGEDGEEAGERGQEYSKSDRQEQTYHTGYDETYTSRNAPVRRRRNPFLWLLIALGFLFLCPFLLGAAALMFGFSLMIICAAGGIALAVIILTVVFVVTGVILFGVGVGKMFVFPLAGMMFVGAGLILFGLGVLSVWLSVMICGKLIPGVIRMIVNLFGWIGRRRRGGAVS